MPSPKPPSLIPTFPIFPIFPIFPLSPLGGKSAKTLDFSASPPLSLYVHVPWCVRKCPYCDFNSHEVRGEHSHEVRDHHSHKERESFPEAAYIAAVIADLESALPLVWGRKVSSVFFGGGTPSLLSGSGLDQLLTAIRSRLPLVPGGEITLEANPGTAEAGKFAAFREAGINRLSLGIQSFNPEHLQSLGRIHDGVEARRAIEMAAAQFDNFNLDLMYGLPGQSLAQALDDVENALSFAPPHLSCYQLTLEPNTAFAAAPPLLPESDTCADMQDAIENRLAAAGYTHYETSAFAQPGRQCQHNLNYWQFGDYLGIGAGAHGKLTVHDRTQWQVRRQMRWKQPARYQTQVEAGQPVQEDFSVPASELPFEFMMNALRLNQGFDARLFELRTARPLMAIERELQQAERQGLLTRTAQRIAPTDQGRRFLNRLLQIFLPE
jgi:oxygen-independent coproporphyrinogen-3 oxidase